MAKKAEKTEKNGTPMSNPIAEAIDTLHSKEDLKRFLNMVLEQMNVDQAAPIYVLTLMNHLLTLADIYEYMDDENKEIARTIWLRMKQQGMQIKNPPLLFGAEEPV